jgi:hypothetical protein
MPVFYCHQGHFYERSYYIWKAKLLLIIQSCWGIFVGYIFVYTAICHMDGGYIDCGVRCYIPALAKLEQGADCRIVCGVYVYGCCHHYFITEAAPGYLYREA